MSQVRRRQFLATTAALLAAPFALAQAPKTNARIGFLLTNPRSSSQVPDFFSAAMREIGWMEGRNLTVEWRFADGYRERLPELASDLVRLGVQVIVAPNNAEVEATRRATWSIPLVTVFVIDPVKAGFAQSLARPGGNVTGVMNADPEELMAKGMQLFKEALPGIKRVGLLYPAGSGFEPMYDAAEARTRALGVSYYRFPVSRPDDVGAALAAAKDRRIDALRVLLAGATQAALDQILAFTASNKIPAYFNIPIGVERGGFMSYSSKFSENVARAASFVDRILNGANPAELPFEYPTRYELVINLKTAKQLGITIPQPVLLRADRVIE